MMSRRISSILGVLTTLVIAFPAHAAMFQQGETLSITGPVQDNLYAAGGSVTVQSAVSGDLLVAGGNVRIENSVGNTLQAAGGQVTVTGTVRNSARLAGGTVIVSKPIGGDLIVYGGQVTLDPGATVAGDVMVFGGMVIVNGNVRGSLMVFGGDITVNGRVNGTVDINAEHVTINAPIDGEAKIAANTLAVGTKAAFAKNVRYWTQTGAADFGTSLKAGPTSAVFDQTIGRTAESKAFETAKWTGAGIVTLFGIYSLFTSALLLILFLLVGRKAFAHAGDVLRKSPWQSLLIGSLYFAVMPVLILLLLVTIIGIPLAFFALFLYVFSWVFGSVITAIVLTRWIEVQNRKHWNLGIFFLVSILVLLGLKFLFFIPVLGWIVRMIFIFMAFGALLSLGAAAWKRNGPYHR